MDAAGALRSVGATFGASAAVLGVFWQAANSKPSDKQKTSFFFFLNVKMCQC